MKRKSGAPRVVRSLFQEKRGVYHLQKIPATRALLNTFNDTFMQII